MNILQSKTRGILYLVAISNGKNCLKAKIHLNQRLSADAW